MNKETKRTLTAEMVKARLIHGAQIAIIGWLKPVLIAIIYFWLPAFLAYYWLRVRLPWAAPLVSGILASVPFIILLIGAGTVCRAFYMIYTGNFLSSRISFAGSANSSLSIICANTRIRPNSRILSMYSASSATEDISPMKARILWTPTTIRSWANGWRG